MTDYQPQIDALNAQLGAALAARRILTTAEQQDIQSKLENYKALNQTLGAIIENAHYDTDVGRITTSIGNYQQEIKKLEGALEEAKEVADTAEARARAVDRREQKVSYHQLYMIDRPLRQLSIPTLFTISIGFIMGAIFFMYKLNAGPATVVATTTGTSPSQQTASGFFNFFKTTPKTNTTKGFSELFARR